MPSPLPTGVWENKGVYAVQYRHGTPVTQLSTLEYEARLKEVDHIPRI